MPDEQFLRDMERIREKEDSKEQVKRDREQARQYRAELLITKRDQLDQLRLTQGIEKAQLLDANQQAVLKQRRRHNREKLELQTS